MVFMLGGGVDLENLVRLVQPKMLCILLLVPKSIDICRGVKYIGQNMRYWIIIDVYFRVLVYNGVFCVLFVSLSV